MIAVTTALFQRALKVGVYPTTKTEWVAFTAGLLLGIALDFVGWWVLSPASFHRYLTVPARRLVTARSHSGEGQGDNDDDPDGGGCAMWAWCPVCDSYRLDGHELCPCGAELLEVA
jgi:hypothetical protein